MRILCLITDAFGSYGGISKFNRDLLTALCSCSTVEEVVAIPRIMPNSPGVLPKKLTHVTEALNRKARFITTTLRIAARNRDFDLIICGHINLLPLSCVCRWLTGRPLALVVHGVDAWKPTRSLLANHLVGKVDALISVSEYTRNRIREWAKLGKVNCYILPNCVNLESFGPGPKNEGLLDRYGLKGKTVLMTLGRLDSQERAKGFDEVLEVLPHIARDIPDIVYLIAGDGPDRARLAEKARTLKIEDRVVFAGFVREEEKADHYRLADAYVMPSRGEGFGIVFLEAMACGIPVIGSRADAGREALRDGKLGALVNPADNKEILKAVKNALKAQRRIPEGLAYFSEEAFQVRVQEMLTVVTGTRN